MLDSVANMIVSVGAEIEKGSFSKAESSVKHFSDNVVSFVKLAGAALASGIVIKAINDTANKFNDLGDVAARVGTVTAKELDRLGYVADLTGSDFNVATASLENLSRSIGEAAQGIGRGAKVFESLGLNAKNANGSVKTTSEVLEDVKSKLEGLSASEQSAFIQRLGLDKSLVGMLTSDTSEIEAQYEKRTQALGINVNEVAELSAEYNDSIKITKRGFEDIVTAFVLRILPPLTDAIQSISKMIDENAALISSYLEPITTVIRIGTRMVSGFINGVSKMLGVLGKWPIYIGAVGIAWKALNTLFAMSPIGWVITLVMGLVTAIGLLVDDFEVWKKGGKSFFDWSFVDVWYNKITGVVNQVIDLFSNLDENLAKVWDNIADSALAAFDNIKAAFTKWWDDLLASISNFGGKVADTVKSKITGAGDELMNGLKKLNPANWFGGGSDSASAAKAVTPSNVVNRTSSTVDNSQRNINTTINVNSAEQARAVLNATNQAYIQPAMAG